MTRIISFLLFISQFNEGDYPEETGAEGAIEEESVEDVGIDEADAEEGLVE